MLRKELYMKYPFLASFLVLCALFYYENRKSTKKWAKAKQDFIDKEIEANNTRKKPLDDVKYISIPLDELPMDKFLDDDIISECIKDINSLKDEPIANFTGITNTDLKLMYGPANLPHLQRCDQSFAFLVKTLQAWAEQLLELKDETDAIKILEYAVSIDTDISSSYYLLAKHYKDNNKSDKIDALIEKAESINSIHKDVIVRHLKEF